MHRDPVERSAYLVTPPNFAELKLLIPTQSEGRYRRYWRQTSHAVYRLCWEVPLFVQIGEVISRYPFRRIRIPRKIIYVIKMVQRMLRHPIFRASMMKRFICLVAPVLLLVILLTACNTARGRAKIFSILATPSPARSQLPLSRLPKISRSPVIFWDVVHY